MDECGVEHLHFRARVRLENEKGLPVEEYRRLAASGVI